MESKRLVGRLVSLFLVTWVLWIPSVCLATESGSLVLTVQCIKDNQDGTYTATFGYENRNRDDGFLVFSIPVGEKNFFSPGSIDRGQPSSFEYGTKPGVFSVTWDGAVSLRWEVSYRIGGSDYVSSVEANIQDPEARRCAIVPYADCIMRDHGRREDGSWYQHYYTYFSYFNPGNTVEIPTGPRNAVGHWCYYNGCEPDLEQLQPTVFLPGHQRGAFRVSSLAPGQFGNTSDVYWYLEELKGDEPHLARSSWNDTRECKLFPRRDCLEMGCKVPGQKGTKTAWFGFQNEEPFEIRTPFRNYYNSLRPAYGCEYNNYNGSDQYGRTCIYPQPEVFPVGTYQRAFGVCFSGLWNGGEEGGSAEDIPLADAGLNNLGRVEWRLGSGWYDYANRHYASINSESRQCNRAPTCAIDPLSVPCAGDVTTLFLNSDGSSDIDGDTLEYAWNHTCSKGSLFGASTPNPALSLSGSETCSVTLSVKEKGTTDGLEAMCSAAISVGICPTKEPLRSNGCRTRDMTSTEYMLADACNAQRKLIDSGAAFLRRMNGDGFHLRRLLRLADESVGVCRQHAWSYPEVVNECPASASCSTRSLSDQSTGYDIASAQLDTFAATLGKKIQRLGYRSWAKRFEKNRRALRANIQRLMITLPSRDSVCP